MKIIAIKTHKITDGNLFKILDQYVVKMEEQTVLVATSKIIAICEKRMVKIGEKNKDKLIKQEADYYLSKKNKYGFILTIKNGLLMPSAGIDESNSNGYYILWPENPQKTVNKIREYLVKRFNLKKVGVIITDSRTTPLRWGTTGVALAHSGFSALNNYIGTPDLFGRKLEVTKASVVDGLAATAVLLMGEGKEQTPLTLISDVPFIRFQSRNPTKKELEEIKIEREDDLYEPILNSIFWVKTKK